MNNTTTGVVETETRSAPTQRTRTTAEAARLNDRAVAASGTCPTCGRTVSAYLSMRELAATFTEPDARPVGSATMRNRGRRIARDLGLPVIVAAGIEFVQRRQLDAITGQVAA